MVWYYARGGQRQGPVEDAEIQQLVASGQVGPGDLVWRSGLPDWRPAGEVPEIARFIRPATAPAPPPPPPPAPYSQPPAPYQAPAPYAQPQSPYAPPSAPLTQSPAYGPAPMSVPVPGPPSIFGAVPTPTTEYASFLLRLGAFLIDQLLVLIVAVMLGVVGGVLMALGGKEPTGEEPIWNILGILITWLYYAGFESSAQMGTLGKRALGLRVTDMEGQRISFARATGRHFAKIISAILLGIGFLMMIFDEQKQTLHDKAASCLVLKQR